MGHKAVCPMCCFGPMCCVMHVKEPSAHYREEKGLALVFLAVAAVCAVAPCKSLKGHFCLRIRPKVLVGTVYKTLILIITKLYWDYITKKHQP